MYQNLKTYSPDGDLMFLANKKKINWYLDRGLAVKIDDSSIKLTFEPKGSGEKIIPLIDRENICVVCGTIDDLTHHHVVPTVIKKRLPLEYREHSSYDV